MYVPASCCIPWLVVFGIECLIVVILNAITIIVFVKQRQKHRKNSMVTNTSNIASHCIPWLFVYGIECLAVVFLNAIAIIVFVKQRQLQRKSTYLIIHLAMVDFFVGAVTGPLRIYSLGSWYCDLWEFVWPDSTWFNIIIYAIGYNSYQISLLNLAFISLERAHATFRPFKHRFVKTWVYGVMITVTWLVPVVMIGTLFGLSKLFRVCVLYFFLYFVILLFVIFVSYVSIYIKVRRGRLPQHHGAARLRERKLTSTLFLVTFGSLFTFLPVVLYLGVGLFKPKLSSNFHITYVRTIVAFFLLNSFINPIIYAIRMPELRAGILQIIFRRVPHRSNGVNIPLQDR
ncbi:lysophosphatidic acid receptor 3-like [Stylophora pistillata]|uniref:lysophosphatidic acid receptor 3-like n=1 Tax=Stylophora pistillata TaxID=50429 RepID=UPI000C03E2EC|nr:lysophosphatidic acid receptor 3-like [Stylophora pistillata]